MATLGDRVIGLESTIIRRIAQAESLKKDAYESLGKTVAHNEVGSLIECEIKESKELIRGFDFEIAILKGVLRDVHELLMKNLVATQNGWEERVRCIKCECIAILDKDNLCTMCS